MLLGMFFTKICILVELYAIKLLFSFKKIMLSISNLYIK